MKFTATSLEHFRFNSQSWSEVMADNVQRLEDTLLKVSGMLDVNLTGLANQDILVWDTGTQKFIVENFYDIFPSTTTTSTTTSTSTSSSSTLSSSSTVSTSSSTSSTTTSTSTVTTSTTTVTSTTSSTTTVTSTTSSTSTTTTAPP